MKREQRNVISRLKKLEHDATPAPWSLYGDSIEDAKKIPVASLAREHFHDRNAEFITEFRNALPLLLRLIEQQDKEIMRLRGTGEAPIPGGPRASSLMQ